jgi:hypothetical protein
MGLHGLGGYVFIGRISVFQLVECGYTKILVGKGFQITTHTCIQRKWETHNVV